MEEQHTNPEETNKEVENTTPETPNEELSFANRIPLEELRSMAESIRTELGKIIVGQHEFIDLLIVSLLSDGHVLIEGVPGIAKPSLQNYLQRRWIQILADCSLHQTLCLVMFWELLFLI